MENYHIPVLLEQSVSGLNIQPGGTYVDCTFGGGGHSKHILSQLNTNGRLVAFDQDAEAVKNLPDDNRILLVEGNFKYLQNFLRYHKITAVDGILADLGVSSHHFDDSSRGFSFRFDAPLDMRMNQKAALTAAIVLNTYTDEHLKSVFRLYGEIDNAHKLVSAICSYRQTKQLQTIFEFKDAIATATPKNGDWAYLAKVFQALRIEVNQEMEALKELLLQSPQVLKTGGRLVVITYHSLEDRLVKNFIKAGNFDGIIQKDFYGNVVAPLSAVNRKIIVPDEAEIEANSRARSAKLRVAQKN